MACDDYFNGKSARNMPQTHYFKSELVATSYADLTLQKFGIYHAKIHFYHKLFIHFFAKILCKYYQKMNKTLKCFFFR